MATHDIETLLPEQLRAFAHHFPTLPRTLGVDVGQRNLALWLGAPHDVKARSFEELRFVDLSWLLISCPATNTNAEACELVCAALRPYCESIFAYASDIIIEQQYKRNGRMKAIARALLRFFRANVPNSGAMTITMRQAAHKFATIPQLPCPMPREKKDRKQASVVATQHQLSLHGRERWCAFFRRHSEKADDISDARLIAQDWIVATYLPIMVASDALASVSTAIHTRKSRLFSRKRVMVPVRAPVVAAESDSDDEDEYDDDDNTPHKAARPNINTMSFADVMALSGK